jgi:hypothetical protein
LPWLLIHRLGGCLGRADLRLIGPRNPRYAFRMKRLRTFLERLPGGHRPPTGPLTTAETTDAEELRERTLMKDKRIEREQEEVSDRPDREV